MANRRVAVKHTAAGGFMFVLGMSTIIVGGFWYPDTVKDRVDNKLVNMIVVESELDEHYAEWRSVADFGGKVGNAGNPTIKNFYLFNITNLDSVLWGDKSEKGNKPVLSECGPYAYEIKGTKFDTHFLTEHMVSYKLQEQLVFNEEMSGEYDCPCEAGIAEEEEEESCKCKHTLSDRITTVNVPYAQILVNLGKLDLTETHITSRLAFRALSDYKTKALGEFIAQQKRGALSRYLTRLYADLRYNEVSTELGTRYPEILTSTVPGTLLSMDAHIRSASIPLLVKKAFRELNILGIWAALSGFYETVRRKAAPRVLNGLYERLKVESTPAMLERMRTKQFHNLVPFELAQTYKRVLSLDTPASLAAAFYEVCFDAVPNVLTNLRDKIINEIKNQGNLVYAQAEINAATQWMKGSVPFDLTNFAQIFDGKVRFGFELNANETAGKSPPDGVSQYLLKPTNSFSFLNKESPEGWPLWRRLIEEQDEEKKDEIVKLIVGFVGSELIININAEQVRWVADYLEGWISNEITILDRLMHWQSKVNMWDQEGLDDSDDAKFYGVNRGLELEDAIIGATFTRDASKYLWDAKNQYSVLNTSGWYTWEKAMVGHREDQGAFATLVAAHPDLTLAQVQETVKWLSQYQSNKLVVKRARKHWSTATCHEEGSVLPWIKSADGEWIVDTDTWNTENKTASECKTVDLDENKAAIQGGFEINLDGNPGNFVSDKITQYLWNANNKYSFLNVPNSPTIYEGVNIWRDATDTSWNKNEARADLIEVINEAVRISDSDDPVPTPTTSADYITMQQVITLVNWIESWHTNTIVKEEALQRWTYASCLETESSLGKSSAFVANLTECTDGTDLKTIEVIETSAFSPFITTNTTLINTRHKCDPFDVDYPYVDVTTEVQLVKIIDERVQLVKELWFLADGKDALAGAHAGKWSGRPTDKFYFKYGGGNCKAAADAEGAACSEAILIEQSTNETNIKVALEAMDLTTVPGYDANNPALFGSFGNVTVTRTLASLGSSKMEVEYHITFDSLKGKTVQILSAQKVGYSDVEMGVVQTLEGGTFNKKHTITYYNRTIYTNTSRTMDYSCDSVDMQPLVDGLQKGWEPNPTREDASIAPITYDGIHYLWNDVQPFSFLNLGATGYRLWLQVADGDTAARDLIIASAPGSLTTAQVENTAKWLASQKALPWLSYQLRRQWGNVDTKYSQSGIPGLADIDLEPFRAGEQNGWSMPIVTGRSAQRKEFKMTDDVSARLWNVSNPASFLNKDGFRLWLLASLVLGEECGEFCDKDCMVCRDEAKIEIAAELGGGKEGTAEPEAYSGGQNVWQQWMVTVGLWVKDMLSHEILIRDVLQKWMNDTCYDDVPGTLNMLSETSTNFTNNASACKAGSNVTNDIDTTYTKFYDSNIVNVQDVIVYDRQSPHYMQDVIQKTTEVQCLYTNISRWVNITNSTNMTEIIDTITTKVVTKTTQPIKKYSCDAQDLSVKWEGTDGGFELDPLQMLQSQRQVPLPVAQTIFDPTSDITFFTQDGFNKWKDSPGNPSFRADIISSANHSGFGIDQFEQILEWLTAWVDNPLTKAQFERLWAVRNADLSTDPLDLDLQQSGIQTGFEVNWNNRPKRSPTTRHAAYLWDSTNTYSFLNPGSITNGVATGFFAWSQVFTGYHPASTRLVLNEDGTYAARRTFQQGNESLMWAIGNATNTLPPCQPADYVEKHFMEVNMSTSVTEGFAIGGDFSIVIGGVPSRRIAINANAEEMAASLAATNYSNIQNMSSNFSIIGVEYLQPPTANANGGKNFTLRLIASTAWAPYNSSAEYLFSVDSASLGFYQIQLGVTGTTLDNTTDDAQARIDGVGAPGYNRTDTITYPCPERNGLSVDLLDQIASWLFSWADNDLLIDLVHEQWAELQYITQEGQGKLPIAPANLNDQIITGDFFIADGFPREKTLLGYELDSSIPYTRPQMRQLWNFSNPFSFLHPPGFTAWRNGHRDNAPETGLLPEQRVPRQVQHSALLNIAVATNTAPDCGANYSNTTVQVFYGPESIETTFLNHSFRAWNTSSKPGDKFPTQNCANEKWWKNETVFYGNATHNKTYPACYTVAEACAATCLPDGTGRLVSSLCGGKDLDDDVQQCSAGIIFVTNTTVHHYGEVGTYTGNIHTIKTDTWFAQAANGHRWELNRTTKLDVVYPVCPGRNGLNREQITDVAAWVVGWADHPVVLSSVQQRWWLEQNASAYENEYGFELHTTFSGESYMSMENKPLLFTAQKSNQVEIPPAASAYLWDVRNEYSFLNYNGMKKWEEAIRHTQNWAGIATHIPGLYSDGNSGPGLQASNNGTLMADSAKAMKVIGKWLESWAVHPYLQHTVQRQWRHGVIKSTTDYRLPTPAPTSAPTKAPTSNKSTRRLIAKSYNALSPLMKEQFSFLTDPQYFDIEPEGEFSNYGRFLERVRPDCTDVDLITPGCQDGFELDPHQALIPFAVQNGSNFTWISADVGEDVAKILWNPADKRSFLHPDGFVAWTEGLKNCSTSTRSGMCSNELVNKSVLPVGSICNIHDQCHTGHFCSVKCHKGMCDDEVNVCQQCDQCKQESNGIDGTCAMHCRESTSIISQRRSAAQLYLQNSLNLHWKQVEHIRDVWLRNWLDNSVLIESSDFLGAYKADQVKSISDLGYLQMGNAGVTKKAFFPPTGHTWPAEEGYEAGKFVVKRKYFEPSSTKKTVIGYDASNPDADGDGKIDAGTMSIVGSLGSTVSGVAGEEMVIPPLGFGEVSAFTKFGADNQLENHQQFETGLTSLSLDYSKRLIDLFTDTKAVLNTTAVPNLQMAKGMYAIQSYVNQPYRTSSDCEGTAAIMQKEFPDFTVGNKFVQDTTEEIRMSDGSIRIVVSQVTGLCTQFPDGYWAGRLFMQNITIATADEKEALHTYMSDLKQYLKYMATKIEYEPRILSRGGGYFTTQTASDLLVTGYRDPLVARFRDEGITALVPLQHPQLDLPTATSRRFSLFHNYTRAHAEALGPRNVNAGNKVPYSKYLEKMNDFSIWNGKSSVDVWSGETVPVEGTDGSQFAPILSSGSGAANKLTVWWKEAVRPFTIDYVQDVTRFGIDLRRYTVKDLNRFDLTSDERTPLNLIDLGPSQDGLPVSLSYPHFLSGIVKTIRDGIDGLKPTSREHETVFDVDPVSGMTMNKKRRWQMNLQIRKTETWHTDTLVPHCERASAEVASDCMMYLPMYWVDERGAIQAEEAYAFKDEIYDEFKKRAKYPVAAFYGGSLLLSVSFILLVLAVRHKAMLQVAPNRKLSQQSNKIAAAPQKNKQPTPSNTSAAESKQRQITRGGGEKAKAKSSIARGAGERAAGGVRRGGGQKVDSVSRSADSASRSAVKPSIKRGQGSPSKVLRGKGEKQASSNTVARGKGEKPSKAIARGQGEKSGKVARGKGEKGVRFAKSIDV